MRKVKRKDIPMGQDINKEIVESVTELGIKLQSVLVGNDAVSIDAAEDVANAYNRLNMALTNLYASDAISQLEAVDVDTVERQDQYYWIYKRDLRQKMEDAIDSLLDRLLSGSDSDNLADQLSVVDEMYCKVGSGDVRNVSLSDLPDDDINQMLKG